MGDLRSQLLQAGLVDEKKAKQVDKEARKERKAKKGKKRQETDPERQAREAEEAARRAAEAEAQRRRHAEKEAQRLAAEAQERTQREAAEAARQLIQDKGRELSGDGPVRYAFTAIGETRVRYIQVTAEQQQGLARGEMGLARPHANLERLSILPRKAAEKLQEICPEKLVLLYDLDEEEDEFGGLMW